MDNKHKSYIDELAPFENDGQKRAVMSAHLKGLKGQMETLKSWENSKEDNIRIFYDRIFKSKNSKLKTDFELLYSKLQDALSNPEQIDQVKYDEIYKLWEPLNKEIGN